MHISTVSFDKHTQVYMMSYSERAGKDLENLILCIGHFKGTGEIIGLFPAGSLTHYRVTVCVGHYVKWMS